MRKGYTTVGSELDLDCVNPLDTPRLWEQHFGDHPLRSDIDRALPQTAPPSAAEPPAAVAPA